VLSEVELLGLVGGWGEWWGKVENYVLRSIDEDEEQGRLEDWYVHGRNVLMFVFVYIYPFIVALLFYFWH